MATAKKLPSGSWRCRVYSHTEDIIQPDGTKKEKKIYKSFTCDDPSPKGKRTCERMASEWAEFKDEEIKKKKNPQKTLGDCIDQYIAERENVCSVRTIRDYKGIRKRYCKDIMDIPIDQITQSDIQNSINKEAESVSPKTIRNIHGLISPVMKVFRKGFALDTTLPQSEQVDLYIPTEEEIKKLLEVSKNTCLEIPILLAAFGPMRRGEICALTSSDINGNIVHVSKNMVLTESKEWVIKTPKSFAGNRYIEYPEFVINAIKDIEGPIIKDINPDNITNYFLRLLRRNKMNEFRFHDLRHYCASMLHTLGMPDAYICQRGGWEDDKVLKKIYRHALKDKASEFDSKINKIFDTTFG